MYITCLGFKGGVAKTTTAIHLAGCLSERGPTLLIDGDANRSALAWAENGKLPFRVVDERQGARAARDFEYVVIDTAARPAPEDIRTLADGCDLLILPTTPEAMALRALFDTAGALTELSAERFRVLLTIVPPKPSRDGEEAVTALTAAGLPVFATSIRRYVAFQKASLGGLLVRDVDDPKAGAAWADYAAVAGEIL
jgi:chromosome partitioning protein